MLTPQPDCDDRIVPIEKGPFIGFRCPFTDNVWVYTDEREFVYLPSALLKTADGAGEAPVVVEDVLDQLEFPVDVDPPVIYAITTCPSDPTLLALWCEVQSSEEEDFDESFLYVVRLSYAADKKDAGSVNFSVVAKTKISPSAQSVSWSPSGNQVVVESATHGAEHDDEEEEEDGEEKEDEDDNETEVEVFQLKREKGGMKLESLLTDPGKCHASYLTTAVPKFFPAVAKAAAPPAAAASPSRTSNAGSSEWIVLVNAENDTMELWEDGESDPTTIFPLEEFIAPDHAEEDLEDGQSMFDDIPVEAVASVGRYLFVLDYKLVLHVLSVEEPPAQGQGSAAKKGAGNKKGGAGQDAGKPKAKMLAVKKFKIPLLPESEEAELSDGAPRLFVTLLEPTKEQPQPLVAVASNCSPVVRIVKLSWEGPHSAEVVDYMVLEKDLAPLGLITVNDGTLLVLTQNAQQIPIEGHEGKDGEDGEGGEGEGEGEEEEEDFPLDLKFIPVSVNLKAPGRGDRPTPASKPEADRKEKEKAPAAIPPPKGGFGGNLPAPFQSVFGAPPSGTAPVTSAFQTSNAKPASNPFAAPSNPFGAPAKAPVSTFSSAFGQPQPAAPTAAPNSAAGSSAPAASTFGAAPAASSTTNPNPFSKPSTAAAPSNPPVSAFGAAPTASAFGAAPAPSPFGKPATAPTNAPGSAFGAATGTTAAPAFAPAPTASSATNPTPFGKPATAAAPSNPPVGAFGAAPATSAASPFGAAPPASSPFGKPATVPTTAPTSAFGAASTPSAASGFGAATPDSKASPFGFPSAPASTLPPLNGGDKASTPGSLGLGSFPPPAQTPSPFGVSKPTDKPAASTTFASASFPVAPPPATTGFAPAPPAAGIPPTGKYTLKLKDDALLELEWSNSGQTCTLVEHLANNAIQDVRRGSFTQKGKELVGTFSANSGFRKNVNPTREWSVSGFAEEFTLQQTPDWQSVTLRHATGKSYTLKKS